MLSPFRVARLVAFEEFDRLLNEVLLNGRPVSLAVRLRLSEPESLEASALGLALRRLTELTWRPEPPAWAVVSRLLARQHPEGGFGSVAASACAVGGLAALLAQVDGASVEARAAGGASVCERGRIGGEGPSRRHLEDALDRGLAWLRGRAADLLGDARDGELSRVGVVVRRRSARVEDAVDAGIVLWQLGMDRSVLGRAGISDLGAVVDALGLRHHRETAALVEPLLATRERGLPEIARRAA